MKGGNEALKGGIPERRRGVWDRNNTVGDVMVGDTRGMRKEDEEMDRRKGRKWIT